MMWLLACAGNAPIDSVPAEPLSQPIRIGGDRPAEVYGPEGWTGTEELPVLVALHGYSANAYFVDGIFHHSDALAVRDHILVLPEGTVGSDGFQFWNSYYDDSAVDDAGYLTGLLDELESTVSVDTDRVYFTGHSNGGYMSYRMACELPDRVAGIAPMAGGVMEDEGLCPSGGEAVPVLHIHGTTDDRVPYETTAQRPGAMDAAERWAGYAGCSGTSDGVTMDLLDGVDGDETSALDWTGCASGQGVSLWTMEGVGHVPVVNETYPVVLLDWLFQYSLADR